jgi:hypothetical protein
MVAERRKGNRRCSKERKKERTGKRGWRMVEGKNWKVN